MPAFYFQQLPLTHGVTLLRSQLCFPCWGKIRGGKACIFPRHGSLGIWGASLLPTSPSHVFSFRKKAFRFGFKALRGTQNKKQGVPATARLTATFICSVSPNTFQLTFQTNISPRGLHSGCGRGEGRYFPSSFRMRQSRPRVSFLNIFITGDPLIL